MNNEEQVEQIHVRVTLPDGSVTEYTEWDTLAEAVRRHLGETDERETCPACLGVGGWEVPGDFDPHQGELWDFRWIPCEDCGEAGGWS